MVEASTDAKTKLGNDFDWVKLKACIQVAPANEKVFEERVKAGKLFKVIVMIGDTGQGKSSTCNSICGEEKFKVDGGL
jgi:predicted GTPase